MGRPPASGISVTHTALPVRARWLCLLLSCLAACTVPQPSPAVTGTPHLTEAGPTPTCYLQPMPTGEKIVKATIEAAPPAQAQPGDALSLRFSGGYVAVNNARMCGAEVVGYVHDDELATPRVIRHVTIRLNDQVLAERDGCPADCQLDFIIPVETPPGRYMLTLTTSWAEETRFELEIIAR